MSQFVTHDQLQETHKTHCIYNMAIVKLLIDKGIITPDEIDRYRIKATSVIDQGWARRRDKSEEESYEEELERR